MTTRAQEILEEIGDPNYDRPIIGNFGVEGYEHDFSPRKLATYLAELEERIYEIADEAAGNDPD